MARLLSQMNREIELGNDIDLNLPLTRLGHIFPPQDDQAADNSLHAAMLASVPHAPLPQRRGEPKTRPADIGYARANVSKMLETPTLAKHPLWIAFSGHSTTPSPKWEAS